MQNSEEKKEPAQVIRHTSERPRGQVLEIVYDDLKSLIAELRNMMEIFYGLVVVLPPLVVDPAPAVTNLGPIARIRALSPQISLT